MTVNVPAKKQRAQPVELGHSVVAKRRRHRPRSAVRPVAELPGRQAISPLEVMFTSLGSRISELMRRVCFRPHGLSPLRSKAATTGAVDAVLEERCYSKSRRRTGADVAAWGCSS